MSTDIGPGDKLEATGDMDVVWLGHRIVLEKGRVYVCSALTPCDADFRCRGCGEAHDRSIQVEGVTMPAGYGFCHCAFRPLPPRSAHIESLINKLSTPKREKEEA